MSAGTDTLVTGLIAGGGISGIFTAVAAFVRSRADARRAKALGPGEQASVAVRTAEHALIVLQGTNRALEQENARVTDENGRLRAALEQLQSRLEAAQKELAHVQLTLTELQEQISR